MDVKVIDLNESVYEIGTKYPEIVDMMVKLGFTEMERPGMLRTAGRFMTIPKGAKMKGVDLELIKRNMRDLGFQVE